MKTSSRSRRINAAGALALATALLAAPRDAHACGGFFCSATPVDQTAEHILFTVNDDHTVTAVIQISYTGQRDSFAWIIPVGGVPTLGADFPDLALRGLDTATQPQYYKNQCYANRGVLEGAPQASADDGVTVLAQQNVGPYQTVTLSGTDAAGLVEWLQKNGYRVTDAMKPIIAPYVADGSNFVAMRLLPDKDVTDITPLSLTYGGNQPSIPIRLTAVAATPEMGIVAFVLANRRYRPDNYVDLKIPDSLIQFGDYGQNNYQKIVAVESDKAGGQAFVTEYAKSTDDLRNQVQTQPVPSPEAQKARDALLPLLEKFPYITRLYARMSAEEMTLDPTFAPSPDTSDVNNVHDLTDPHFNPSRCPPTSPPPDPCLQTYCGVHGLCVGADIAIPGATPAADGDVPKTTMPACVCGTASTARPVSAAYGQADTYCEPLAQNLDAPTPGLTAPACEGVSCGPHGTCTSMNQNPTCQCEPGYGAVAQNIYDPVAGTYKAQVTCEQTNVRVATFRDVPPMGSSAMTSSGGCNVGPSTPARGGTERGTLLGVVAGLAAVFAGRRRFTAR